MTEHAQENNDYGMGAKTFNLYLIGFFLCILLTLIPFATVKYAGYSHGKTLWHIYVAAILQAIIQIAFFLRLNWRSKQSQMNLMAFGYAIVLAIAVIAGSIWIMWNLNHNMM